ncbi:uncharacterized protein RAG0_14578 [Rhynchosporium agropyri]|uniref:Ap4A phosphorylase 1/2 N-terminal domain-containing protein n=1 Tax=Rhynchosporium agropyri TaxID=914238 RepID=A0A1E1LHS3_9HELO|nr:uncharacterized protein RAG0_14578 [Rhynchosporium agropyri]
MASQLVQQGVLATFDEFTRHGIIQHGPSEVVPLVDDNFAFEVRICSGWSTKPLTVTGPSEAKREIEIDKFGPGSNITLSHPRQIVSELCTSTTHTLALNICPVVRLQYLLLTKDSYRLQTEPMDLDDMKVSWDFLKTEGGEKFYVMYNCGQDAGCSRSHKHMQIVPKPESLDPATNFRYDQGSLRLHLETIQLRGSDEP